MGDLSFNRADQAVSLVTSDGRDQPSDAFTLFGLMKTMSEATVFTDNFPGTVLDTVNNWSQTIVGTATVTVAEARCTLNVGAASSAAQIRARQPHRAVGSMPLVFRARIRAGDTGVAGNVREWGVFDDQDGYMFRLNGSGLSCVIRRLGAETVIPAASFSVPFTLDTNAHRYAIQYVSGNVVAFVVDGVQRHAASAQSENLVAEVELPTTIRNENTTNTGAVSLMCLASNIVREGANFKFDDVGRLAVFTSAPEAPPNTIPVTRGGVITMSPNSVVDDIYTITNNKRLTIQAFKAGSVDGGVGKIIRVELFEDPNGDLSVLNRIDTLYVNSDNFERNIGRSFDGNGVRRILLRSTQIGAATMETFRQWNGFEI